MLPAANSPGSCYAASPSPSLGRNNHRPDLCGPFGIRVAPPRHTVRAVHRSLHDPDVPFARLFGFRVLLQLVRFGSRCKRNTSGRPATRQGCPRREARRPAPVVPRRPSREHRSAAAADGLPSRPPVNARRRPSGDQRGDASRVPEVSGRGAWLPSALAIQMFVSYYPSSRRPSLARMRLRPSGEIWGSATQTNLKMSVSVIGRRCAETLTAQTQHDDEEGEDRERPAKMSAEVVHGFK